MFMQRGRTTGVTARGIRTGLIRVGDDLQKITLNSVLEASQAENITFHDRDVVAVTESLVARAQGNYVTQAEIASDLERIFGGGELGVVFPIFSRNRFLSILEAICLSPKFTKIHLLLNLPTDEQGNSLVSREDFLESEIDPYTTVLTATKFKQIFTADQRKHLFTGMDYIELYESVSPKVEIILANNPTAILEKTKKVLVANVHDRQLNVKLINEAGGEIVHSTAEVMTQPISRPDGSQSGYCPDYGLLGSNMAKKGELKLFPRDGQQFVNELAKKFKAETGKQIEVMIYADGAFKDPVGGIWELADPVVSPAYTPGLQSMPDELKLKYLTDNEGLTEKEIIERLKNKQSSELTTHARLGTTPRQTTDLLGSLADLVSGSGDKGTPIILIQGYFDNLSHD